MKILDLTNTSASAKELLLDRALYLEREYGVECHILSSRGPYVEVLREHGIRVHVLDTPRNLRLGALLTSFVRLIRLLREERFDIIHSHGSVLGLLTRLTRPFTSAKIVHTVHGLHTHENMFAPKRWIFDLVERQLSRLTDLLLVQNREDFRKIRSWVSDDRARWIGNGIQLPTRQRSYEAATRNEYRLCCVARFEPVKNHVMLIDAFHQVLKSDCNARLVCLGDGSLRTEIEDIVKKRGIEDKVEFRGYVDDPISELVEMDLNLLTSVKEGLPRALIEAMALGIPSVATDVKGSREVLKDGVTGILVELGDAEAFAAAIVDLLNDPERRAEMSRAAVARARSHFDETRICERLMDSYVELVSDPRPPSFVSSRA